MRYSNAAYTSRHTVIPIKSAMLRLGFLRYSDEASKRILEEANAAFRTPLVCIAREPCLGRKLGRVQFVGSHEKRKRSGDGGVKYLPGSNEVAYNAGS